MHTSRFASDFEWAWLRFSTETGALEEFIVIDGGRLILNGETIADCAGHGRGPTHLVARRGRQGWEVVERAGSSGAPPARSGLMAGVLGDEPLEEVISYVRD